MARFTQSAWADKTMRATAADRRTLMQDLARGLHEVADDTGRKLDFSPGPTHCTTAPAVEITKDEFGRTKMKHVNPVKREVPSDGTPRLSPDDKRNFDAFMESFKQLPPAERSKATQKLLQIYIPRLIHD